MCLYTSVKKKKKCMIILIKKINTKIDLVISTKSFCELIYLTDEKDNGISILCNSVKYRVIRYISIWRITIFSYISI